MSATVGALGLAVTDVEHGNLLVKHPHLRYSAWQRKKSGKGWVLSADALGPLPYAEMRSCLEPGHPWLTHLGVSPKNVPPKGVRICRNWQWS